MVELRSADPRPVSLIWEGSGPRKQGSDCSNHRLKDTCCPGGPPVSGRLAPFRNLKETVSGNLQLFVHLFEGEGVGEDGVDKEVGW